MDTELTPPRELPIVGGHLALDLANTVDDPDGPKRWDHVATTQGLLHWAQRVGLIASESVKDPNSPHIDTASLLTEARQMREDLHDVFGAIADAEPVSGDAWNRLRPFIAEALSSAFLIPTDSGPPLHRYDWSHLHDLRTVIHPVAAAASELLTSTDLVRLKRCGRCPWLFLDHSKNQSRRWCDMNDCGRAEKNQRYVAKRAAHRMKLSNPR